jgi:hypothetical protein
MFLSFRRKEQPWEVVDCKAVNPVLMYGDDDDEGERDSWRVIDYN